MFGSSTGKRVCPVACKVGARIWVNPSECSEFGLLVGRSCDIGPPSSTKNCGSCTKASSEVGGVQRDPSDIRVSCFLGKRRQVLFLFREERAPFLVLPKGDFVLIGGEVAHTFGLTSAITLGMAKSYGEPVGAKVWDEGIACHAALMARGEGAGMVPRPDPSTSDTNVAADLDAELEW
ncbi:hypothetical protein BHE74_00025054 [Ensete ventricosum]|nr:hypothetical protein BHE74_00025054 [Ensete ventricosum]